MSETQVLPLMPPPEREDALSAVGRAIGAAQRAGWTMKALARIVGCDADTIERAAKGQNLMCFDAIARIAFHVPQTRPFIIGLWDMGALSEPTTLQDRAARMAKEIAAIQRELDAKTERAT